VGTSDLSPLYGLVSGNVSTDMQLPAYKAATFSKTANLKDLGYKNADSFAYATLILGFSNSAQSDRRNKYQRAVELRPFT
jgi:hypothetical protein